MFETRCPHCGTDHTQALAVMLQLGTQRGRAHATLAGLGFGPGPVVGLGLGSSTLFTQTDFARRFQLPPFPGPSSGPALFCAGAGAGLLLSMLLGSVLASLVFLACVILALVIQVRASRQARGRQDEWRRRRDYQAAAWVCHRCGRDFLPREVPDPPRPVLAPLPSLAG